MHIVMIRVSKLAKQSFLNIPFLIGLRECETERHTEAMNCRYLTHARHFMAASFRLTFVARACRVIEKNCKVPFTHEVCHAILVALSTPTFVATIN